MKTFKVAAEFYFEGDLIKLNDLLENIGATDYTIKTLYDDGIPEGMVPIEEYEIPF